MIKSSFKIVILAIIGFALLIYLTAPENPNKNQLNQNNKNVLNIDFIPRYFEIVGSNPHSKFETIFQKGVEKYLIVLNHDSLALFKDLHKYTDKNIVLIANISNTPWLIKKLAVNGK